MAYAASRLQAVYGATLRVLSEVRDDFILSFCHTPRLDDIFTVGLVCRLLRGIHRSVLRPCWTLGLGWGPQYGM